jgi:hypothetical protein
VHLDAYHGPGTYTILTSPDSSENNPQKLSAVFGPASPSAPPSSRYLSDHNDRGDPNSPDTTPKDNGVGFLKLGSKGHSGSLQIHMWKGNNGTGGEVVAKGKFRCGTFIAT